MKSFSLIVIATAATLAFSSCQKNEKAAVEDFKKDLTAVKAGPKAKVGEMVAKLKAINTDDLPADLKTAWAEMLVGLDKMSATMAEVSKNPKDLVKSIQDPNAGAALKAKLQEMSSHLASFKKLEEVAKKYGIDGIDKIVPQ